MFMAGTTINRIDEVLAPFVTESLMHRKIAEEWHIPMPKATPVPAPRKSATTPSSRWNMK